jgi:subtilisin-like proprotein convertase family protein
VPRITRPPRATEPRPTAAPPNRLSEDALGRSNALDEWRVFSSPQLNFEGIPYSNARPPDTVGDAGPNHYIQMVNDGPTGSAFAVYSKSGNLLAGPLSLQTLGGAGACASGRGDPIVLYDRLANRWLMSEIADTGNHLCVYISLTPDPISGGWLSYDFTTPNFPDYPKYAVWPDAYYVSTNEPSPAVYALDRQRMLSGQTATFHRFTAPELAAFGFQALIPGDHDGPAAPPAGSPNYFMRHRDDEAHNSGANNPAADFLEIWEFHVDFATPANSTLTGPVNISIAEFDSSLCGLTSISCFAQPGTTNALDPLREVIMWRLQYLNRGTHQTLVGNFVTDVNGADRGGIRWFELRRIGAGSWTLFQQGTHSPDADNRWMGSIAMDKDGNMALAYSVSSSSVFPSIRYTGRLSGDPAGQLQAETTLIAGGASQTGSPGATRWGDYSAMSVDPADDCTFWYTNEYIPAGTVQWRTRVGTFKFDTCQIPIVPAISITDAAVSEGNSGTKNIPFLLTLSAASTVDVTVNYSAVDGTAVSVTANTGNISIPASGQASPYPSTITVASGLGLLTNVKVKLNGWSHTFASDVDVLLVGPGGQSVVLMSDVGSSGTVANVNLTFDDTGPPLGAGTPASGTYMPTNIGSSDTFSTPAPAGPYGTTLSVFNGTDPAGVWKLFVIDDGAPDVGNFSGGWVLELTPVPVQDYTANAGSLTFPSGTTSQYLNISIIGDTAVEPTETFLINLSNPVNASIADGQATGTVHNDDGSGTSPTITTQPAGQTISAGQTATLSVQAGGTTPLTYQWYIGTSGTTTNPIPGATGSTYTTPALTSTTSYWVKVTNGFGDAASTTATVTIGAPLRRRGQVISI